LNFKGERSLKNRFPFRLGTTSYIIPAELLPNVIYLADKVDDIELVLFESDEISNLPDAATVKILKETAEQSDLTYTIHLPMDTWISMGISGVKSHRRTWNAGSMATGALWRGFFRMLIHMICVWKHSIILMSL
jgi:hypothetical protein